MPRVPMCKVPIGSSMANQFQGFSYFPFISQQRQKKKHHWLMYIQILWSKLKFSFEADEKSCRKMKSGTNSREEKKPLRFFKQSSSRLKKWTKEWNDLDWKESTCLSNIRRILCVIFVLYVFLFFSYIFCYSLIVRSTRDKKHIVGQC